MTSPYKLLVQSSCESTQFASSLTSPAKIHFTVVWLHFDCLYIFAVNWPKSHCRYLIDTIIDLIWHNQVSELLSGFFGRILFLLWFQSQRGFLKPACRPVAGTARQQAVAAWQQRQLWQPRTAGDSLGRSAGAHRASPTWRPLMLMEAAKRYWGWGIFGVITLFFNIGNAAIGV